MVQKYYNSVETAKILDVSAEDVKAMLDRRELHGYRDGADWKFKVEDIDGLAKQRQSEKPASPEQEPGGDVLLSEVALGQGAMGSSGTVIAMDAGDVEPDKSDIRMPDSDVKLGGRSARAGGREKRRGRRHGCPVRGVESDLGRGYRVGRQQRHAAKHACSRRHARGRIVGHRP